MESISSLQLDGMRSYNSSFPTFQWKEHGTKTRFMWPSKINGTAPLAKYFTGPTLSLPRLPAVIMTRRSFATLRNSVEFVPQDASTTSPDGPSRIKFKRPDKTARHIMQIGLLLLESVSLLGYFALFHPENQAVLRWGKSPTILHKVCDLPFVFFSDPELMPILAGILIAACFGCDQNKSVILQELSMDMLLSLLKSCKNSLPPVQSLSVIDNLPPDEISESNHLGPESKKLNADAPPSQKSHRSPVHDTPELCPRKVLSQTV